MGVDWWWLGIGEEEGLLGWEEGGEAVVEEEELEEMDPGRRECWERGWAMGGAARRSSEMEGRESSEEEDGG